MRGSSAVTAGIPPWRAHWEDERPSKRPPDRVLGRSPPASNGLCGTRTEVAPAAQEPTGSWSSLPQRAGASLQPSIATFSVVHQQAKISPSSGHLPRSRGPCGPLSGSCVQFRKNGRSSSAGYGTAGRGPSSAPRSPLRGSIRHRGRSPHPPQCLRTTGGPGPTPLRSHHGPPHSDSGSRPRNRSRNNPSSDTTHQRTSRYASVTSFGCFPRKIPTHRQ